VQIIFFLAGLQKINGSIYEAAKIDGANSWIIFWKMTLPLVKPFLLVNAIYTIVDLASFANNPVNTSITQRMFDVDKPYSYSAALSWIYFVSIMVLIGVTFLLLRPKEGTR
jgi:ABC-type sugar transport system permease subunit